MSDRPDPPLPLRLAVGVLAVQALTALAVGMVVAIGALTRPADGVLVAGTLVLSWGGAVVLAVLAHRLLRCRGGARNPAVAAQLLLVPIGYYLTIGGSALLGVPLLVLVVATVALLVAPSTRAALGIR